MVRLFKKKNFNRLIIKNKTNKNQKMNQKEKARAYDAQQLVDKFNKQYPVGSSVKHRTTASKSIPFNKHTVRAEAFVANSNMAFAFFNEVSGYCSIEADFVQYL